MDSAQNVDEKNEIICLVIMLTLGVIFIKMSQWLIFFILC